MMIDAKVEGGSHRIARGVTSLTLYPKIRYNVHHGTITIFAARLQTADRFILKRTADKYTMKYVDFCGMLWYRRGVEEKTVRDGVIYGRRRNSQRSIWI